ncbi:hypothetical protein MNV49_006557 [Pseudohyphozyma bogoriensis]|nr:hypothetical protein MNV49_006557 [Pseudohyphozyma bogoriensis]
MIALSDEVLQIIVSHLDQVDLVATALVSRTWSATSRRQLFQAPEIASTVSASRLLRSYELNSSLQALARSLILRRRTMELPLVPVSTPTRAKARKSGTSPGKASKTDDAVQPEHLVRLTTVLKSSLEELVLKELPFSLRRRHIQSASHLTQLRSLTVYGAGGEVVIGGKPIRVEPFSLHTVGQLLVHVGSTLRHLALRNIVAHHTSFDGLQPHEDLQLSSLALFNVSSLESQHLSWLLRSTAWAESLRTLAMEWDGSARVLNPVRYVVLRVTDLYLTTRTAGIIENMALHFPSLRHFHIQSTHPIDVHRLFANLDSPIESIVDRSPVGAGLWGMEEELAIMIWRGEGRMVKGLKSVVLRRREGKERKGVKVLDAVCELKRIQFRELAAEDCSFPYVPDRFEALRPSVPVARNKDA